MCNWCELFYFAYCFYLCNFNGESQFPFFMNVWGIDVYKKEVLSFLWWINKLMLLSICIDSMVQSGVLLSLGPWKILKLLKIFWYSLFFSYFQVRHGHGAHLATHWEAKTWFFLLLTTVRLFGKNRKNMEWQFFCPQTSFFTMELEVPFSKCEYSQKSWEPTGLPNGP